MLWFVFVPVAAFFIVRDMWSAAAPEGFIEWSACVFFSLFFTSLTAGACAIVAALLGLAFSGHPVLVRDVSLTTIRDKDGVSGQFFLGSGFVHGEPYYFYYEKLPDGSLRPGNVAANGEVRVYEESRNDAEMKTFEWQASTFAWLVSIPVNSLGYYNYEFRVPKGTVRSGYTM